ncbi:MAG: ABC transporter permease [Erysipelotrichaceae bacterium]|nr:ABC transporter permease [Erysipelotrichaceae bacterium]
MTIIEMIRFSLLRIKRHKENIYFILIMAIFTIILLTALNVYHNINSFIDKSINSNIGFRTISVSPKFDYDDLGQDELSKINHVIEVYSSFYDSAVIESDLTINGLDGKVELLYGTNNTIPDIVYGTTITKKGETVCPINFYPDSSVYSSKINESKILPNEKYLNKTFNIKYYSYEFISNRLVEKDEFIKSLKIVGFYDNKKNLNFNNQCYVLPEDMKDVRNATIIDDSNSSTPYFSVVVDDATNVKYVENELQKLKYTNFETKNLIDSELINIISLSCLITLILVVLIVIFISGFYTKKRMINEMKFIGVLKVCGYDSKLIHQLYFYQTLIINSISSLLGFVIFTFGFSIIKNKFLNIFKNVGIIFSISMFSILLTFLIVVGLSLIFTTFRTIKLTNKKIRDLTQSWE